MKTIGKISLTTAISKRVDRAINKRDIYSAIEIICEEVSELISNGEPVRIPQFGTLAIFPVHGHRYVVPAGRSGYVEPNKSVKLYPNAVFKRLITERKESFKQSKSS